MVYASSAWLPHAQHAKRQLSSRQSPRICISSYIRPFGAITNTTVLLLPPLRLLPLPLLDFSRFLRTDRSISASIFPLLAESACAQKPGASDPSASPNGDGKLQDTMNRACRNRKSSVSSPGCPFLLQQSPRSHPLTHPPSPSTAPNSNFQSETQLTIPPYLYHGNIPSKPFASSTPPETFLQHVPGQTKCHFCDSSIWQRTRTGRGVEQMVQDLVGILCGKEKRRRK